MEQKKMADKLAEKAFKSAKIQKSWKIHAEAFGPILEPAFAEDYKTRIELIDALNKISKRDIRGGIEKLRTIYAACQCDADQAAWLFFMGLAFEMAGDKDQTIQMYQRAGAYGHRFYLPYLKVAKFAHNDSVFEVAEENYKAGIACLEEGVQNQQTAMILASVYTNYASCLTMMHRYRDAELAIKRSIAFLPILPNRAATQAILSAAIKDTEETKRHLTELERQQSPILAQTKQMTAEILGGAHPHFAEIPLDEDSIAAFWKWFNENEGMLAEMVEADAFDQAFYLLQGRLKKLFPYLQRDPDCAFTKKEGKICITFADYYVISLDKNYHRLIDACPEEYQSRWCFEIVH